MAKNTSKEVAEQVEKQTKPQEEDLNLSVAPKGISESPEFKATGAASGEFENETQTIIRN